MNKSEQILQRQKVRIRFQNTDMDFALNWALGAGTIVGMSHGEIFGVVSGIKDGDPESWRDAFRKHGRYLSNQLHGSSNNEGIASTGFINLAAAHAYRASLQYADPTAADFSERLTEMETCFALGLRQTAIPMRAIDVPFEGHFLPGYFLEIDNAKAATLVMVGGGDTFREDLFWFAGYAGWQRGYNVLMVDLPGQGKVPAMGLPFRTDMAAPISSALDWLLANAKHPVDQIAIYGVSGGGFFTAQATASDHRIKAWIASTPIIDVAKVFAREFGAAAKTPGWLMNALLRLVGSFNFGADLALKKYAWQFGTSDFKSAIDRVLTDALPADHTRIACPSLFLMGESEAPELKRQTLEVFEAFKARNLDVSLRTFTIEEGADAHCQINNLRLAHRVIFDWLDRVFGPPA